jgi:small GTP-binding protein
LQIHKATTGVDFYLRKYVVDDTHVLVQLWDIAGQDRFGSIYRVFYQHALGALVVFDVTEPTSLVNALRWKRQVDSKCTLPNGASLPVWLCANKCDLEPAVDMDGLTDFCRDNGFAGWLATSAKTGENVDESVQGLIRAIVSHVDIFKAKAASDAEMEGDHMVDLAEASPPQGGGKEDGKCC